MAGTSPDFNSSEFRSQIKATMRMGIPGDPNEQLRWHFAPVEVYSPQDPALRPYNWSTPPDEVIPGNPDVPSGWEVVDYAMEFAARPADNNSDVGRFDTSRLVITVLDVDYEKIKTADYAMIGNNHYEISFKGPPMALFDCTIYQFYMQARDQS